MGNPSTSSVYRSQLRELLTQYGPIHEVWHDGANGGDGYYGGAREKRTIDKRTYYDWPATWALVRSLQPNAVIFSDVGPDIRWVGNERGEAGETCWATYAPIAPDGGVAMPGLVREKESPIGTRFGARTGVQWMPAECDVSIRPGWFWHSSENSRVKTAGQLMELYYRSVGRGAGLLLNVPPDRRGLLDDHDVASLEGFRRDATQHVRDESGCFCEEEKVGSCDGACDAAGCDVQCGSDSREYRTWAAGRRIRTRPMGGDGWNTFAKGTSVGARRIIRMGEPITARRVRVRFTPSADQSAISELGLFFEPK